MKTGKNLRWYATQEDSVDVRKLEFDQPVDLVLFRRSLDSALA
jgi:hypothetical protein